MLHANKEKWKTANEKIRTLKEQETYKYLGILETDTIEQVEMKEKNKKEYPRRMKKSEHSKNRKLTNIWEYWKRTPSNKWR